VFANNPSIITGTHTIYDPITGRVDKTEQLLGLDIDLGPNLTSQASSLTSPGTVISFSLSLYDANDRVVQTQNDYGLRTQTLYDSSGRVIESRTEMPPATGLPPSASMWSVSRTIYDNEGKVIASTDRFLVPLDTPLGQNPIDPVTGQPTSVPTQITKTIYDDRNRTIATERYTGSLSEPQALAVGLLPTPASRSLTSAPSKALARHSTIPPVAFGGRSPVASRWLRSPV
jgi:YD repeat-containing protein